MSSEKGKSFRLVNQSEKMEVSHRQNCIGSKKEEESFSHGSIRMKPYKGLEQCGYQPNVFKQSIVWK